MEETSKKVRQREIRDYLHLYLGQECRCYSTWDTDGWKETVTPDLLLEVSDEDSRIGGLRLMLRPLSDMTSDELKEWIEQPSFTDDNCNRNIKQISSSIHELHRFISFYGNHDSLRWLLSKGFDLFGLIEEGLAIDKTKSQGEIKTELI